MQSERCILGTYHKIMKNARIYEELPWGRWRTWRRRQTAGSCKYAVRALHSGNKPQDHEESEVISGTTLGEEADLAAAAGCGQSR